MVGVKHTRKKGIRVKWMDRGREEIGEEKREVEIE
jgi:hypothetical protein